MESLMMQLALAALGQFGGGGMNGPMLQPRPIFQQPGYQQPGFQRPIAQPSAPSQATTLAAVTCRMRQGEISRIVPSTI